MSDHELLFYGMMIFIGAAAYPVTFTLARAVSAGYFSAKLNYHRKLMTTFDKEAS